MTDYISRADAIEMAVDVEAPQGTYERAIYVDDLMALPLAELPNGDLISRADAMNKCKNAENELTDEAAREGLRVARFILGELPSADAVPTIIRAKALMRKEDFDKWADDIKKQNQNIVCIPCDAEVVSSDAVQGYTEWLEQIIVDNEGANVWLCEDTPDLEWCDNNCNYSSIQAECLRHLYEVSKGGDSE